MSQGARLKREWHRAVETVRSREEQPAMRALSANVEMWSAIHKHYRASGRVLFHVHNLYYPSSRHSDLLWASVPQLHSKCDGSGTVAARGDKSAGDSRTECKLEPTHSYLVQCLGRGSPADSIDRKAGLYLHTSCAMVEMDRGRWHMDICHRGRAS